MWKRYYNNLFGLRDKSYTDIFVFQTKRIFNLLATGTCTVHSDFVLLILNTHTWLHMCFVNKDSTTKPTWSHLFTLFIELLGKRIFTVIVIIPISDIVIITVIFIELTIIRIINIWNLISKNSGKGNCCRQVITFWWLSSSGPSMCKQN